MSDDSEWEQLVEEYYEPIYRFCFHMCKMAADAEDATQQTFLKAFQKRSSLKKASSEKAWFYQIARNTCIDRIRRAKRLLVGISEAQEPTYSPNLAPVGRELKRLIEELPQKQREVFILRHLHDLSTEETAHSLKVSTGTVKAHLKRAVDRLREKLEATSTE